MNEAGKECTKCKQTKEIAEFYSRGRSWCINCERTSAKYRMGSTKNKLRRAHRHARIMAENYGVYDDLTLEDIAYTFKVANNKCVYCGKLSNNLELEHIKPMSRGGSNTLSNVMTSCRRCNRSKHTDSILRYALMHMRDEELILSLIDRIAFRSGNEPIEVYESLKHQFLDYAQEQANLDYQLYLCAEGGDRYSDASEEV